MHDDVTIPFDEGQRRLAEMPAARDAWGSFRLIGRVGHGGFGEVYRAWDPHLEREVALKLLLPDNSRETQSEDEEEITYKEMLREARALASVRHPNIVPVHGIDRHDGRVGFWTDFVKGKTLSALVGAQGPFGDREATLIALDVTRALSAVHRAGILHRDIKAENVMREEGGRILLMDFGLSTLPLGQTNIAGSPNYMAPELWQGFPASVESDIFSMGVLLYFLVTGEHPAMLGGLTAREAAEAITKRRPLIDLRSDLPEPFLRTVNKAMESDPARRFSSAGQLAAALAECLGTGAPMEMNASPVVASRSPGQRWLVPIAGAALVLGAVALKTPTVRRWLNADGALVPAEIPRDANEQYSEAQELMKKSYKDANVAEAVTIFQHLLRENPKLALAQAALGNAYFTQYRNSHDAKLLDLAKESIDKALGMQGDLAPALATRARIEAIAGQTDAALQDAKRAVESNARSPEAHAALAEAYDASGRKPETIDEMQKAVYLDPDNSTLPVRLGNYYLSYGKLDEAAAQWQNAVTIDRENIFAYFDLGLVNMRLNKLAEAQGDFEKILQLGPDAESYLALGTISQLQGKYEDAVSMDKKAIALDPTNQQAWADLGNAYLWSGGSRENALQPYRKAIELGEAQRAKTPGDANLLADLANYYASIGNAGKSLPLVREAVVLSPSDPYILYSAGDTYELLKDRATAIPLIARALASGFRINEFERSPELAGLRGDPAFTAALKKARRAAVDSDRKLN